MITQEICPHKEPQRRHRHGKPLVAVGSDAHKKAIFESTMEQIYNRADFYDFGTEFRVRGKSAIIINFCKYEECEWDGLKCKPLEMWSNKDNDFFLCHPSDLRSV